jgi:D-arabinose 1-dehydrogenase-like Zn-dependent alcohol dehydrogenase
MLAYRRALTPHGRYRCVGGSVRTLLRAVTIGPVVGALTGRSIGILAVKQGPSHFEPLAAMCSAGSVKVNVDSVYPLDEVPEALERVGEGRALGKVVITMGR